MSAYDDASPELQALADKMIAEVVQSAMDAAKLTAMMTEYHLDEGELMLVEIGIQSGLMATIEWLRKHGALKDGP